MKHLKLLRLVGLAAISLLLLAGAATSSATVLCKATATPCESTYEKEATIHASMSGTSVLTNTEGVLLDSCGGGSAEMKITQAGSGATKALGELTSLTWSECSATTDTVFTGSLSIDHITGTDNGTVTSEGTEVTAIYKGVSCTYGTGAGTYLGPLRGRENPVIEINTVLQLTAGPFECPRGAVWRAKYTLSEPLFVEPGGLTWCATTTVPCGSSYEAGATFKAGINGSMLLETLGESALATCTSGTLNGAVLIDGGELGALPVPIESLTWGSCNTSVATTRTGELDFVPIAGTDNAKVLYTGTEVTYEMFGVSCGYGGSGGNMGTFKGGEKPTVEVNVKLLKFSGGFLCPKEVRWTGEYKVEEPTPLYVEGA